MHGMLGFDVVRMGQRLTELNGFELTHCAHVTDVDLVNGLRHCPKLRGLNLEG
jgi:hypothetical protein